MESEHIRPGRDSRRGQAGPGPVGERQTCADPRDARWLPPDDDLAPNRPGEALRALLCTAGAGRRPLRVSLLGRPPGPPGADAARLRAEQRLGAALDALEAMGWRTVHAVPLPNRGWISHLTVGPGGVYAVRTVAAGGRLLRVDEDRVHHVGALRKRSEPAVRMCRRAAAQAQYVLSRALGDPVTVTPLLGVVGDAAVEALPGEPAVRLLRERDVPAFGRRAGVHRPQSIDTLHTAARDRRAWLGL